ncbi:MAG TPA: hypothetical protein VLW05_03460 [Gaiellaceae bacterium]|nr:hypothetical protein [Gaiellaceae bacterium]
MRQSALAVTACVLVVVHVLYEMRDPSETSPPIQVPVVDGG